VNGWETARTARLRSDDELIPKAEESLLGFDPAEDLKYELAVDDDVEAIRRASVIAGCRELRATNDRSEAWGKLACSKRGLADLALTLDPEAVEQFENQKPEYMGAVRSELSKLENLLEHP
jgi:glutamine synthetase type III